MYAGRTGLRSQRWGDRLKLLANENIPLDSVRNLRNGGHDVVSISERSPGISDEDVIQVARMESRIVLTFDRDYGDLVFRRGLPAPAGILYLRFVPKTSWEVATYVSRLIEDGIELEGRFTTADRGRIRQTMLDRLSQGGPV